MTSTSVCSVTVCNANAIINNETEILNYFWLNLSAELSIQCDIHIKHPGGSQWVVFSALFLNVQYIM